MKKILSLAITMVLALQDLVFAAAPNLLTYQGRLQESGAPADGQRAVEIALCRGTGAADSCFSTGIQSNVPVSNGLFRTNFAVPSAVDLGQGPWYLEVRVGVAGATANLTPLSPREALSSSPYALHATTASALAPATPGGSIFIDGNVGIGTTAPTEILTLRASQPNIRVTDTGGSDGLIRGLAGTFTFMPTDSSQRHVLSLTASGNSYFNIYGGNVGIGTAGPGAKLEVAGGNILMGNSNFLAGRTGGGASFNLIGVDSSNYLQLGPGVDGLGGIRVFPSASGEAVMVITNSGNVGIGTTGPSTKLHVYGIGSNQEIRAEANVGSGILTAKGTSSGYINLERGSDQQVSSTLLFKTAGTVDWAMGVNTVGTDITSDFRIDSWTAGNALAISKANGNVGIGTTNPTARLEVKGGGIKLPDAGTGITFSDGSTLTSASAGLSAGAIANTVDAIITADSDSDVSGEVVLKIGSVERLRISNEGRVGISVSPPATGPNAVARLLVQGVAGGSGVDVRTDAGLSAFRHFASDGTTFRGNISHFDTPVPKWRITAKDSLHLTSNDLDTGGIFLNTSGNVGIGTTSPGQALQVVKSDNATWVADFLNTNTAGNSYGMQVRTNSASGTALQILRQDAGISLLVVQNSGNVGIGTTTPAYPLEVIGQARVSSVLYAGILGTSQIQPPGSSLTILTGQGDISTTGAASRVTLNGTFAPASGTASYSTLNVNPTINQTGGANGVTRGVYVNPTLTSAPAFRAIETVVGDVILGSTGGNVGIGTATPSQRLQVEGNIKLPYTGKILTGPIDAVWYDQAAVSVAIGHGVNGSGQQLQLYAGSATPRVYINGTFGYVGIGKTNPDYMLDVNGIINAADIYKNGAPFSGSSQWTGTNPGPIYYNSGNVGIGTTAPGYGLDVAGTTHLRGSAAGPGLFVDASGNVGIGTTVPLGMLKVAGGVVIGAGMINPPPTNGLDVQGNVGLNYSGSSYKLAMSASPGLGALLIQGGGASPTVKMVNIRNNSEDALVIMEDGTTYLNGGNVGIGTATPGATLDVNGSLKATSWASQNLPGSNGAGYANMGGIILQWGTFIHASADGTAGSVTLPIAFPNAIYAVLTNVDVSGVGTASCDCFLTSKTLNAFSWKIGNSGNSASCTGQNWFAIGR